MISVQEQYIVIAGAARSGVAVAGLLARKGARVLVSDAGRVSAVFKERMENENIPFEEHGHSDKSLAGDFLVISPGVPSDAAIVKTYQESGRPVYSEIEVASWFCKSNIIAVTGSNGKTTVVSWLADVWKRANRPYLLAGNIGTAFSDIVEQTSDEVDVILEVSSFQLDHIDRFRARVGVLLNITPDHLNRYQNQFENYIRSKMNLPLHQSSSDTIIYGYDDPVVKKQIEKLCRKTGHPEMVPFSTDVEVPGACLRDGIIRIQTEAIDEEILAMNQISLPGTHNLRNGLAVALTARICEIEKEPIRESLTGFEGVPHRLQLIRKLDGVSWYNDSKATNVNAVWYALTSFKKPIVLIMGGRDKGNDYSELVTEITQKVKAIVAIGEGRPAIREQLGDFVPQLLEAESMSEAVQKCYRLAQNGDVVLLSPACASFDMFDSYEDRGVKFIQSVMAL